MLVGLADLTTLSLASKIYIREPRISGYAPQRRTGQLERLNFFSGSEERGYHERLPWQYLLLEAFGLIAEGDLGHSSSTEFNQLFYVTIHGT